MLGVWEGREACSEDGKDLLEERQHSSRHSGFPAAAVAGARRGWDEELGWQTQSGK